ncbi:MAG TPA: ATP-binding cassette domain-containing protein [Candidatus Kapabacteria bacterium]|nr:ATP-binding cassette domain-containing protein [Candidatus Kapabacteria bacterium]
MSILSVHNISVRFNDRFVLEGLSLTINEGARIGMVGRNGSGKSTLLKIIAGLREPDSGEISKRRDLLMGYLPQAFSLDPELTVEENIRAGAKHITELIHEFESLPGESKRHHDLEQQILAHDGWHLDTRIATAMSHLNCPPANSGITKLSGGEQRRVALCRAIISQPDLLILDEPTNHLDTESIEWLAEFLENYPGTFLVVTHDRYFLDRITNTIVEVANGKSYSYEGNYTDYLLAKAEREATAEVTEHKRQMFLRRELEWVRRGPKARTTKSKSRLDRYFEVAGEKPAEIDKDVDLVIPPAPQLANRVVDLTNVGMEFGGRWLFSHLNLNFAAGQRVGVFGRNGLGKTTLLKLILGQIEPMQGTVKIGMLTKFNYVDQGRLQLNEDRTVLEEISDGSEFVIFGEHKLSLRAYLKRFLFTDDRITSLVKHLSGGERSRLLLARILKHGGNFLILDEPTNDLDLATLRVLEEALIAFDGVVVVVSHDRYFLNRVCTAIVAFEGEGKVAYSEGNYDYYLEKKARAAAVQASQGSRPQPKVEGVKAKPGNTAKLRKLSFKEARELEGMEEAIAVVEAEIARIEALFSDPEFNRKYGQQMNEINDQLAEQKAKLNELFARWEELEAIKAGSGAAAGDQ